MEEEQHRYVQPKGSELNQDLWIWNVCLDISSWHTETYMWSPSESFSWFELAGCMGRNLIPQLNQTINYADSGFNGWNTTYICYFGLHYLYNDRRGRCCEHLYLCYCFISWCTEQDDVLSLSYLYYNGHTCWQHLDTFLVYFLVPMQK